MASSGGPAQIHHRLLESHCFLLNHGLCVNPVVNHVDSPSFPAHPPTKINISQMSKHNPAFVDHVHNFHGEKPGKAIKSHGVLEVFGGSDSPILQGSAPRRHWKRWLWRTCGKSAGDRKTGLSVAPLGPWESLGSLSQDFSGFLVFF